MIYWGGNHQTIIPRMGACGSGTDPKGGSGGGAGSGGGSANVPIDAGKFDFLDDFKDWLKDNAGKLALGALAVGLVAGALVYAKKRRKGGDTPSIPGFEDSGFDIEGASSIDRSAGRGAFDENGASSGFDSNGLPNPPEYVGQQVVDEDGNLWVYKDPPGEWINFGDVDAQFLNTGQVREVPIYQDYESRIREVQNQDIILTEKSWAQVAEEVGNIGPVQPNLQVKFEDWYVEYDIATKDLYTYLRFNNDTRVLTTNFKEDTSTYTEYPHSIVYKLYEPLPDNIQRGDFLYVVKEMAQPYEERVQLIDFVDETLSDVVLRQPKFESDNENYFSPRDTQYKTYTDLTTSNTDIAKVIENEVISGSFGESIELNGLDFRQFKFFSKFSSVEDRLGNFKYKLQQIELFESQSLSLLGISGSHTANYTASLDMKARKIKNEFTPFEKYMYFESSSYISSSLGIFHDNAWPKKSGTGTNLNPYVLYSVSESIATSWYDRQIVSASNYDRENRDRLLTNIPAHIRDESQNDAFLTFINMTGEHFDGIWSYINQIPAIHDRRNGLNEGLSKDLIYHVGRSLGFYLNDGKDLISLPRYVTGAQVTGSDSTSSTFSASPERDISREIWKRILANMPFFLKTKGTLRSFKGLINCYGIPSSILRVREYGGPQPEQDAKPAVSITRNFTKALEFKGNTHVLSTWVNDSKSGRKPDTVEFRFRSATASGSTQTIVQAGDDWAVRLKDNSSTDNYGFVEFVLSGSGPDDPGLFTLTSEELPIYDGEFYSVMLTRLSASVEDSGRHYSGSSIGQLTADTTSQNIVYSLHVGRYDSGVKRILRQNWVSGSNATSSFNGAFVGNETLYIGGNGTNTFGTQFSGSLMEFRYWNSALNSGSFQNRIAAPKSYDGNHASASWEDLVLRYSFNDDKDLSSDGDIRDTSADQSYFQTGSAQGYTSGNKPHFRSIVDEEKARVPGIGPNRRVENKVRVENNKLVFGGLAVDQRAELSAYDLAPLDSNRLGIFFSPTDVINEDIIRSVANLDFDQYVGDPRDKYKRRYRQLEDISTTYWQKYTSPNNFWDYIRLIRFYDQSIFEQLKRMIPARANANLGILIEPNILERRKEVIGAPPNLIDQDFEGAVDANLYRTISGSQPFYTSSIDLTVPMKVSGSYLTYTGSLNVSRQVDKYGVHNQSTVVLSGSYLVYTGSIDADIFRTPSLYIVSSSIPGWGGGEEKYGETLFTIGGPEKIFSEVLQPNITGSRLSEHNFERRFFYTTQASAAEDNFFSSSLVRSDKQNIMLDNQLFRLSFLGSKQTKRTTLDKLEPVTVTLTNPTTLITKDGGDSKLKVL